MNFNELKSQLQSALAEIDVMEVLDPESTVFKDHKRNASLAVRDAFASFAPCPDNPGCDGCECGYPNKGTGEDKDPIGGGGSTPQG